MLSEYADALPLLHAALLDLKKGQVVKDERYGMGDLMAAIEINDARTDTYLATQYQREKQDPLLPLFEAGREVSPEEVVWIADEVVRLEATFQDGNPLASTLWTCNYLRPSSLATVSSAFPSSSNDSAEDTRTGWRTVVLRALLLGTLKSSEIMWEEMCKGQVYEHEDVHLSLSSLSFNTLMASCFPPSSSPPSTFSRLALPGQQQPPQEGEGVGEKSVTADDVLRALDGAGRWLEERLEQLGNEKEGERKAVEELRARVSMRIDLLYTLAYLTSPPHTSPSQLTPHLTRLTSYLPLLPPSSPPPAFAPPPAVLAAFSPTSSALIPLLPTQQPPRPVVPFTVGEAYGKLVKETAEDVTGAVGVWEEWVRQQQEEEEEREADEEEGEEREGGEGWATLREWTRERGRRAASPYVRSLGQTIIHPPTLPSHLFSHSPLLTLTTSFLSTLTYLSPLYLSRLTLLPPSSPLSSSARAALQWAESLVSTFLNPTTSALSAQNRGRQRRIVIKSVMQGKFEDVEREAKQAVGLLKSLQGEVGAEEDDVSRLERIPEAVRAHVGELVLEALMSGFEADVGLFSREGNERARKEREEAWFVGEKIAGEVRRGWERLSMAEGSGKKGSKYVEAKMEEAKAVEELCRGCLLLSLSLSTSQSSTTTTTSTAKLFSSPFLPSISSSIQPFGLAPSAARGRFEQRFGWLDGFLGSSSSASSSASAGTEIKGVSWDAFEMEKKRIESESLSSQATAAHTAFTAALASLTRFGAIPLAERGAAVRPELGLRRLVALRKTASANAEKAKKLVDGGNDGAAARGAGEGETLKWESEWFPYMQ